MTKLVTAIAELRASTSAARSRNQSIGLVPTMGFLHAGHSSLMRRARSECDIVVVTIFVNPLQFGPNEDLASYPRDLESDLAVCEADGVDLVFAPSVDEMYPDAASRSTVHVAGLGESLCGRSRPGHFDGVTTVVSRLFDIIGPSRAYFGQKDAQQLAIVTRMVVELGLDVQIVGCPLIREADGLALSSRNAYLSPEERAAAPKLHQALLAAERVFKRGVSDPAAITRVVRSQIELEPLFAIDYVECVDTESLVALDTIEKTGLIVVAARIGRTRLIDNLVLARGLVDQTP